MTAIGALRVEGVPVEIRTTSAAASRSLPYGDELRELMIVPAVAVNVTPRVAIVPLAAARQAESTSASSC